MLAMGGLVTTEYAPPYPGVRGVRGSPGGGGLPGSSETGLQRPCVKRRDEKEERKLHVSVRIIPFPGTAMIPPVFVGVSAAEKCRTLTS